jgi:hypothetical protein
MAATARHTPPGRYRHFKGREYEVIGVALHSESAEELVVYRPLYGSYRLMVRPAAMFQEVIERDGIRTPRFVYLGATTLNKLTPLQWHAARDYLLHHARPLEAARYRYHFERGTPEAVLGGAGSLPERRRRLWPRAGAGPAHTCFVGAGDQCGLPDHRRSRRTRESPAGTGRAGLSAGLVRCGGAALARSSRRRLRPPRARSGGRQTG